MKSHSVDAIAPSSVEVDVNVTSWFACGEVGEKPNAGAGGLFGGSVTLTVLVVVVLAPWSSVTRSFAV